jgi:hypothetical protein
LLKPIRLSSPLHISPPFPHAAYLRHLTCHGHTQVTTCDGYIIAPSLQNDPPLITTLQRIWWSQNRSPHPTISTYRGHFHTPMASSLLTLILTSQQLPRSLRLPTIRKTVPFPAQLYTNQEPFPMTSTLPHTGPSSHKFSFLWTILKLTPKHDQHFCALHAQRCQGHPALQYPCQGHPSLGQEHLEDERHHFEPAVVVCH